jgi:thiol:disulfide interchange protein
LKALPALALALLALAPAAAQTSRHSMAVAKDIGSGTAGIDRPVPGTVVGPKDWAHDRNPIYDEHADAAKQIAAALARARTEHKRVILDFGGNWCGDCHALDRAMRTAGLKEIIEKNYVVVPIDVGRAVDPTYGYAKNGKLAARYGVALKEGVPAVAILDERGKVLFAQKHAEFVETAGLSFAKIQEFFEKEAR